MVEEKIITINLRRKVEKSPGWRRSNRAVKVLKEILEKNVKTEELKIDKKLNEKIWEKSSIPAKIRVRILKIDDKTSKAELMEK